MQNLRAKLLLPTLLIIVLCVTVIVYVSVLQYSAFQREAASRLERNRHCMYHLITELRQASHNIIELLSNDWHFLDSLSARDMDALLSRLTSFHESLGHDFVAVYDLEGRTIARGDAPEHFGKPDDIYQHIMKTTTCLPNKSVITMYEGNLLALELKRLETKYGPVGVLAVGQYIDKTLVDRFARVHETALMLLYENTEVLACGNARISENTDRMKIEFTDEFGQEAPLSVILLEDVSDIASQFWNNLFFALIVMTLLSGTLIYFSRQIVMKTVGALDTARASAEEELIERRRAEEALSKLNCELEERIQERTKSLQDEVTERKRTEEALRESESRYKTLFNNAGDIIFIHDLSGHTIDFNDVACERLGYSREALMRMTPMDIDGPEHADAVPARINELREVGHVVFETAHVTQEGRIIPTEVSSWLIEYAGMPAVLSVARDISERKRAEEEKIKLECQLRQAQKLEAVGTLAGGIAHDFNNLLTTVQGNASLMLYDIDFTHPHYELLQEIIQQVRSGAGLTAQLLGYARKGKYQVRPFNLNQLVEDTSHTFGRVRKEITIHRELAPDLLWIAADRSQIEQILFNLYVNAADAMPTGGTLTLRSVNVTHKDIKDIVLDPKPGSYVQLTVTDTGTGMDKETQERIFEPFFTTKEMGRGTGLGLASVYGIIKGHGGYIGVESEKGRGTNFSIYLPASDKKVEAGVTTADQIAKGSGTILFVDDEVRMLNVGVRVLTRLGYTVLEARSGREAIAIYEANKDTIDLVVLDIIMPEMGGGEVYDRMKAIKPDVKVLLSSGYSIEGRANEILERGCDGFIPKPFELQELSGKVRELLDKE